MIQKDNEQLLQSHKQMTNVSKRKNLFENRTEKLN